MFELKEILGKGRPSGGVQQVRLAQEIVKRCPPGATLIENGGVHLSIGDSKIGFFCHLDTVQERKFDGVDMTLEVNDGWMTCKEGILGADDGAGVYVLCKMIEKRVPGNYFFTFDEEVATDNGIHLLAHLAKELDLIVSFDRRGTDSVCISQMGVQICSDERGTKIAKAFKGVLDDGIYTDACLLALDYGYMADTVNLSVGYRFEHTNIERLDMKFLEELVERACSTDWTTL